METRIDEIAPDIFRLSTWVDEVAPPAGFTFNQFLVRDEEPLLFHTGFAAMFADVRDAVDRVIEPSKLRWISYSHFEPDECGSMNEIGRASCRERVFRTV